ncbi:MAG: hypothetical protein V2A74_02815 [bacterium]
MKRVRKPDGFYRDELPRAGLFTRILMGAFSFLVGGLVGVGAFFYVTYGGTDDRYFRPILAACFFGGGIIGLIVALRHLLVSKHEE